MLEKADIKFNVLYAEEEEGRKLARSFHITQAPTLLVPEDKGYRTISNVSNITSFVDAR